MPTQLQPEVAEFFRAQNAHDTEATMACFAPDAVVFDEGEDKELHGTAAIREWVDMVHQQYKLHKEVTGVLETDGETEVTARVSGTFPGSPIVFHYRLAVRDGKIARLAIRVQP